MPIIQFSKKHKIKEDHFIEAIFRFRQALEGYKKQLVIAGIAALLLVVIVILVFNIRSRTNDEANALFGSALMAYQEGRLTEASDKFKQLTLNFGGSNAAPRAAFLHGSIYYDLGNYQLAVDAFKKYLEKYSGGDFLNAAVYKGLGASYMQLKDYPKAVDALREAISKYPTDFDIPDIRYKLARCHIETREAEKAKTELSRIIADFPKSAQAKSATLLLAAL